RIATLQRRLDRDVQRFLHLRLSDELLQPLGPEAQLVGLLVRQRLGRRDLGPGWFRHGWCGGFTAFLRNDASYTAGALPVNPTAAAHRSRSRAARIRSRGSVG